MHHNDKPLEPRLAEAIEKLENLANAKHLFPVEKLVPEKQLAKMIGMSVSWVRHKRMTGDGIPFIKIGRSVRYNPEVIANYLRQNMRLHTSDNGGTNE